MSRCLPAAVRAAYVAIGPAGLARAAERLIKGPTFNISATTATTATTATK